MECWNADYRDVGYMNRPLRLLLVEDSEDDAVLLAHDLCAAGYELVTDRVETAAALEQALEEKTWDAVISDYNLPRFSAPQALEIVRGVDPDLPFIVVSGGIGEATAVACMKAGAHDFIMKANLARLGPAIERELRDAEERRARKQADADLRKTFSLLRATLDSTVDGILAVDTNGHIETWNQKFAEIWSVPESVLAGGDSDQALQAMEEQLAYRKFPADRLNAEIDEERQVELVLSDGRTIECSSRPQQLHDSRVGRVWSFRDITDRKRAEQALQYQAVHDALTGLPNRILLQDRLRQALLISRTDTPSLALLIIDLDRFKEVNDTFGHHVGDELLQQVSSRLASVLRSSDTVARLGGDEFAVLLPNAEGADAERCTRRILEVMDTPFELGGHAVVIGASIGIGLCPDHGRDAETLMRRADVAMYVAKGDGGGYAFYSTEQDQNSASRLELLSEFRSAIDQDQLLLHYQPVVQLASRQPMQLEALVRWLHPQQGLLMPDRFVPLAEQWGMVGPLSQWVTNAALRQEHAFHRSGLDIPIAVNLSVRDVQNVDLPEMLARLLDAWVIDPSLLKVEITESAVMSDPTRALRVLNHLRQMGVELAIDDFGTGYASMTYLNMLPIDELKIDKSFVMGITANDSDAAIVRAIIELAHQLGIKVIAEGIENQATWDLLVELGCDAGQGYFVSRPLPALDMVHWLSTWKRDGDGQSPLVVPSLRVARLSTSTNSAARAGRLPQRASGGS